MNRPCGHQSAPLRQAEVFLHRRQIRSPAQALGNGDRQIRHFLIFCSVVRFGSDFSCRPPTAVLCKGFVPSLRLLTSFNRSSVTRRDPRLVKPTATASTFTARTWARSGSIPLAKKNFFHSTSADAFRFPTRRIALNDFACSQPTSGSTGTTMWSAAPAGWKEG
jgi:hypothetical protein